MLSVPAHPCFRKELDMKIISAICDLLLLIDYIYMKVKYKEWGLVSTLCLVAFALFVTVAINW